MTIPFVSNVASWIGRHKIVSIIVLALVAGGAYRVFAGHGDAASAVQYLTADAQRGVIVESVSGTGQIDVADQATIVPDSSGKVVSVTVAKGDAVTKGDVVARLDARDALQSVHDAEISLDAAKAQLDDLRAGADAQQINAAKNAVAQAERDVEKAQETDDGVSGDIEQELDDAYADGYDGVSTAFFKLSDFMNDLRSVLGTSAEPEANVKAYRLLLGENSPFVTALLDDFSTAESEYDSSVMAFRNSSKDDGREATLALIGDTYDTTEAIAQALESARHMYDAATATSYTQYNIKNVIDQMQPKVESDLTSAFSAAASLKSSIDGIETIADGASDRVKDARLALDSAKETLDDRRAALNDLVSGADDLDVRTQENTVAARAAALTKAREQLAATAVRAPFDGTIADVGVEAGDTVSSGTSVATLITDLQVAELSLNEVDIAKVKLGQSASLVFDAVDGLTLTGKVTDIASTATSSQGVVTYAVVITLDATDARIKPGMTTDATVITGTTAGAVYVPNSAVKSQGDQSYVEVLVDGSPVRRNVEIGVSNDDVTQIVSGIDVGESVVTSTLSTDAAAAAPASSGRTSNAAFNVRGLTGGGGGGFRGGGGLR